MRRAIGVWLGLIAGAGEAAAQQPVVTVSPVPAAATELTRAEIEGNAPINLTWEAQLPSTGIGASHGYCFQITYDRVSTRTETASVVRLPESGVDGIDESCRSDEFQPGQAMRLRLRPQMIVPYDAETGEPVVQDKTTRSIFVQVYKNGSPGVEEDSDAGSWDFTYDTKPPPAPSITEAPTPGDRRLIVRWTPPADTSDVFGYEVQYCPTGSGTETSTVSALPCDLPQSVRTGKSNTEAVLSAGLQNGEVVVLGVRARDEFGNSGALSNLVQGTPQLVRGFLDEYIAEGGQEDGGFCFIATAAFGDYDHPVVRVLRWYRDAFLMPTAPGRALVRAYYRWSPPAGLWLAARPSWRSAVQVALVFVAIGAPLAVLALLLMAVFWLRRVGASKAVAAAGVALAVALPASSAQALEPLDDWTWALELRGGRYRPEMGADQDSAFGRVLGNQRRWRFGMGLDVRLLDEFVSMGVGGRLDYTRYSGLGRFADGTVSADPSRLHMLPARLEAFVRLDAWARAIALAPYARVGVAYYLWWTTNARGEVVRAERPGAPDVVGRGGKPGWTATLGIALLLDALEPRAARGLWDTAGVRGTFLFLEAERASVDGFGAAGFDLSDTVVNGGLSFSF